MLLKLQHASSDTFLVSKTIITAAYRVYTDFCRVDASLFIVQRGRDWKLHSMCPVWFYYRCK